MLNGYNSYNIEASFRQYLSSGNKKASPATIKNYLSDLRHFLGWLILTVKKELQASANIGILSYIQSSTIDTIELYKAYLYKSSIPLKTINRRLSALRKFFSFCISQGWIDENPAKKIKNLTQLDSVDKISLVAPIREISEEEKYQQTPSSTAELKPEHAYTRLPLLLKLRPLKMRDWLNGLSNGQYSVFSIQYYIALAVVLVFMAALGAGIYNQFFKKTEQPLAYPSSAVRAGRILSFQGRLTDSLGNPISTATTVRFRLYGASTSGTNLYDTSTCTITPDQDGIFDALIGGSGYSPTPPQEVCGTEIPNTVFTENANVYLGVTVGSDSEMIPRQQIANVGYAINSETLQGFPLGTGLKSVPFVNSDGALVLSNQSPVLRSQNGTFTIEGQAVTMTTPSGSSGDISFSPASGGDVLITSGSLGIGTTTPTSFKLEIAGAIGPTTNDTYDIGSSSKIWNDVFVDRICFDGSVDCMTSGASTLSGWTDDGTLVRLTTSTDSVTIGSATELAKLGVDGDTDEVQLLVQANGAQTSNLVVFENSAGTDQFTVTNSGNVTMAGDLSIEGNTTLGNAATDTITYTGRVNSDILPITNDTYNLGSSTLIWNDAYVDRVCFDGGVDCMTSSGTTSTGWTDDGTLVRLTTSTDNVTIGSATELAKLGVDGDTDEIQFLVQGNGTQTSNLAVFENSAGTDQLVVTNAGDVTATGDLAVNGGDFTSTATTFNLLNATVTTLNIGGAATAIELGAATGTTSINNDLTIDGNTTIGNASGDTLTANAASWTFANDANFVLSGGVNGLSFDTDTLSIDATNDRVGIGDTGPDAKLEVLSTTEQLRLTHTDGTVDSRLTVDSSGNLTIDNTGTKTVVADDFQVTGNDILDSSATTRLTLGSTNTITGNLSVTIDTTLTGDLAVNGDDITSDGDLTINPAGGQVIFADTDVFNIGGLTAVAYNALANAGEAPEEASISSDNDLYIGGDLEVDGTIFGATGFNCTDCIDFDDIADTMTLDANLTIDQTTFTWTQNFTGTTTTGLTYNANSLTSGKALSLASTATAFTGNLFDLTLSGSNAANTGTLLRVSSTGALNAGTIAMFTNAGTGSSFLVNDDGTDTDTTPFIIDASGNIGIGTTTPASFKLEIAGSIGPTVNDTYDLGSATRIWNDIYTDRVCFDGAVDCMTSSSSAGGWTDDGTLVRLTTSTDNVTVGSATELAKLAVDGDTDEIQFLVQGNSTQTSNLVVFENSGGTDQFTVTNAGNTTTTGDLAVNGGDITSSATTFNLLNSTVTTLNVGGAATTISVGASTGAFTLNNPTFNCTDCIDFDDLDDTLDLDSTLTLNQGANTWTQNFTSTTTVGFTYNANSLTTGTALALASTATSFDGELLTLSKTGASGSTSFTSDIASIAYSQTFNATGTSNTGNILDVSRAYTVDDGTAGAISGTISGAVASISDNCIIGTADTCTHTADVLRLTQDFASASGAVLNIDNGGADGSFGLRVNDDGTATDSTPFVIDGTGNIGIGTTTPASFKLEIAGSIGPTVNDTYDLGSATRIWNDVYVDRVCFDGGTDCMTAAPAVGAGGWTDDGTEVRLTTSTDEVEIGSAGLLAAKLAINGDADEIQFLVQANSTQTSNLAVFEDSAGADLVVIDGSGNIGVGTAPSVSIHSTGNIRGARFEDHTNSAYYVDPAGAVSAFLNGSISLDGGGTIDSNGNNAITIDSGTATTEIVGGASGGNTTLCVTFDASAAGTCDGKIDAGTVDPPYTINGKKYATYLSAMTGVKEETTGTIQTREYVPGIGYKHVIDFNKLEEGSDLWLFSKTSDLKQNIRNLVALLTPSGNTRVWYMVDEPGLRLIVYSSRPATISYRLTAPRFDYQQWANARTGGGAGFILNDEGNVLDQNQSNGDSYVYDGTNEELFSSFELEFITEKIITAVQNVTLRTSELIAQTVRSDKVISPIVETDLITSNTVKTEEITPKDKNVTINLDTTSKVSSGQLAKLIVKGLEGKAVASIDAEGNATFSGTLTSKEVQTNDLTAQTASVSGTLSAREVKADNITSIEQELSNSKTDITSVKQKSDAINNQVNEVQALLAEIRSQPLSDPSYYQDSSVFSSQYSVSSSSASLNTEYGIQNTLNVQNLAVNGTANLYDVFVVNSLSVNNLLFRDNSIISLASELKLTALSSVDILEGAVVIARDGTLTTKGTLIAQGLVVRDVTGRETASIDASGSAKFNNLAINSIAIPDKYLEATSSSTVIAAAENYAKNGLLTPAIETQTQSAGIGILPDSQKEVIIYNDNVKKDSLLYLTPTTSGITGQISIIEKEPCNRSTSTESVECRPYFKVGYTALSHPDIRFNWLIIN